MCVLGKERGRRDRLVNVEMTVTYRGSCEAGILRGVNSERALDETLGNWSEGRAGRLHRKASNCCRNKKRTQRGEWFANNGVANLISPYIEATACVI